MTDRASDSEGNDERMPAADAADVLPAAEAAGSDTERMPPADADNAAARGSVDDSPRVPQPGVDVPDRRGRTGLDRVGRDLHRNPRVRVRDVHVLTSNWYVTRVTSFDFQHADGRWSTEERVKAVLEVLESKFIKRGITLRSLDEGEPFASGKEFRIEVGLKNGIDSDNAKKISKIIRDEAPKSVKSQIQGDELRVSSKSRDDLQATMALLKGKDLDVALQFVNFR